ncbi:hypothetical protein [Chamaesiphon sp.]|uniref:hypothetical protein n=1 Tax=Chamaesiphon sp. TaxID=2814140 RepID=UPI00359357F8
MAVATVSSLATAAIANSPAPPERYWLKFTPAQPASEGLQIIQCESPQCQKPLLIMQYKTCTKTGCVPGEALVQHTVDTSLGAWQPHFACIENTCFWSFRDLDLGKSHNFNRNLLKIIAQYPDLVRSSNIFKLLEPDVFDSLTDIPIAVTTTDLRVSQPVDPKEPSPSKNGKNGIAQFAALAILLLSVGSELPIAYFYFRRQPPA